MFIPGTYSFDVTLGGGAAETGTLTATVGAGQLGMHMLFDWAGNNNIDVFVAWATNSVFGSGIGTNIILGTTCTYTYKNCLWTGKGWAGGNAANAPAGGTVWMLASVDGNGDGVMGIPMPAGGPFPGFNINFNANLISPVCDFDCPPVPVPAAVWLFGSGLMGLAATARRKKKNRDS